MDDLNAAPAADFVHALDGIFEHAPWVAERAAAARPFATVADLHTGLMDAVRAAPAPTVLAFLNGHPELAGSAALSGAMAAHSVAEQTGLGLNARPDEGIAEMNAAYGAKFGFPFIVSVRRHTRASLLATFRRRLRGSVDDEHAAALREIGHITRLRLVELVSGPGAPVTVGSLTTHVLDAAVGQPAPGIPVELFEVGGDAPVLIAQAVTNHDGRTDAPLMTGAPLRMGTYELRFRVGAYFAPEPAVPPFLDLIPVRFGITAPETHYHVPLLVAPGAYSTYRGS